MMTVLFGATMLTGAQSLKEATEKAQEANAALMAGNHADALEGFKAALKMASACGDEGAELTLTCQTAITQIMYSNAKQAFDDGDFDNAIAKAQEAKAVAAEYGNDEFVGRNESVITNAYTKKASTLMNAKDFDGAAAVYKQLLELNPDNGAASLNLVRAFVAGGKVDDAKAAFELAKANGKEAEAAKLLGTALLKQAAAKLQAKDYAGAVAAANESNGYNENAKAYLIAGQASQKSGKNDDAIENFSKYLELAPNDKNAGAIAFTVGALYQQAGNKKAAAEYYQKAVDDPKLGAEAQKALAALK
ncbi:MAG: tetratricopeptide repeat protein [Bacteroidales bacterium]|nr:tetratricopeptide repeat protein [Bacteroidales bacterium]